MSLYLGSYFFAFSTESYIKPNPVDFPPPKWVRNLKTKIEFGSLTSYILANRSFSSAYKGERHISDKVPINFGGQKKKRKEETDQIRYMITITLETLGFPG